MTKHASKPMTIRLKAITACFALCCTVPLSVFGAAMVDDRSFVIEPAQSDSSATVVFTLSVSVERMVAAPTIRCQLRPNPAFEQISSAYGFLNINVPVDSVSGTGSVAITQRFIILDRQGRRLRADQAVHVRCQLQPGTLPSTQSPSTWEISQEPPVCPRPGAGCAPHVIKPGAVLEVSGEAR